MEQQRRAFLCRVMIALVVWAIIMQVQVSHFDRQNHPNRLDAPVLHIELATNISAVSEVLNWGAPDQNIDVIRANTYLDFLFIFLYWSVFVLFGRYLLPGSKLSNSMIGLISIAAILDVLENWRMLACLDALQGSSGQAVLAPADFSYLKCLAFAAALVLLGLLIKKSETPYPRALVVMLILSGVLIAGELAQKQGFYGTSLSAIAIVVAIVHYWPRAKGIMQTVR